jgi:hypothetical protein
VRRNTRSRENNSPLPGSSQKSKTTKRTYGRQGRKKRKRADGDSHQNHSPLSMSEPPSTQPPLQVDLTLPPVNKTLPRRGAFDLYLDAKYQSATNKEGSNTSTYIDIDVFLIDHRKKWDKGEVTSKEKKHWEDQAEKDKRKEGSEMLDSEKISRELVTEEQKEEDAPSATPSATAVAQQSKFAAKQSLMRYLESRILGDPYDDEAQEEDVSEPDGLDDALLTQNFSPTMPGTRTRRGKTRQMTTRGTPIVTCVRDIVSKKTALSISTIDENCHLASLELMEVVQISELGPCFTKERRGELPEMDPPVNEEGPLTLIYDIVIKMELKHAHEGDDAHPHMHVFFYNDFAQTLVDLLSKTNDGRDSIEEMFLSLKRVPAKCIFPCTTSEGSDTNVSSASYCIAIGGMSKAKMRLNDCAHQEPLTFDDEVKLEVLCTLRSTTTGQETTPRRFVSYSFDATHVLLPHVTHVDESESSAKQSHPISSPILKRYFSHFSTNERRERGSRTKRRDRKPRTDERPPSPKLPQPMASPRALVSTVQDSIDKPLKSFAYPYTPLVSFLLALDRARL